MKLILTLLFVFIGAVSIVSSGEDVLADKIQKLTEWSLKKPVIRLNSERFKHYVKTAPRNYSIVVMLTALSPQRQCTICKEAHDEFEIVAQSYRYSNAFSDKLFFGMVDFDEGADIFQSLKLNSAPVFIHFPAKAKPKKADYMDLSRRGFSADQIIKWIQDRTDIQIHVFRPPNYMGFVFLLMVGAMAIGFLYTMRNNLGFIYSRLLWAISALGAICYFISGQTWNLINGPPFMSKRQNGAEIFADDSNMQYVAETYIVFLLYFGVCAGMILLNEAPKMSIHAGKRPTMIAGLGILMVVLFFSFLLSVFRAKYQGYPYSFLIK